MKTPPTINPSIKENNNKKNAEEIYISKQVPLPKNFISIYEPKKMNLTRHYEDCDDIDIFCRSDLTCKLNHCVNKLELKKYMELGLIAYESTLNLLKSEIYQKEDKNIFYSNKNNIQINDINRYSDMKKQIRKCETEYFPNKKIKKTLTFKSKNRNPDGYDKILKKLNFVNKALQKDNKALLIACEKMDKKQAIMERFVHKRDELKKQLGIILSTSELTKKELIKNLSNELNSTTSSSFKLSLSQLI